VRRIACCVVLLWVLSSCGTTTPGVPGVPDEPPVSLTATSSSARAGARYPGTEEGARQMLGDLRGGETSVLARALAPSAEDYQAVFEGDFVAKAQAYYEKLYSSVASAQTPVAKTDQTELQLWAATSDELKSNAGNAAQFPTGYADIAPHLKSGLTFYRWKYVTPGSDTGMAYEGLVHVGSRWVWFPKPWKMLDPAS
jgi:hypothetical protein